MLKYNSMTGYNKARYNADGTELSASDSFTVSDITVEKESRKNKAELLLLSDSTTKQQNKEVTDTIRLNDWTRFKKDQPDPWSD